MKLVHFHDILFNILFYFFLNNWNTAYISQKFAIELVVYFSIRIKLRIRVESVLFVNKSVFKQHQIKTKDKGQKPTTKCSINYIYSNTLIKNILSLTIGT